MLWDGGGAYKLPPLAEELLAIDGCQEGNMIEIHCMHK